MDNCLKKHDLWKYRIFNKYNLIAFFVVLITSFGLWVIDSPVFSNLPFTFDYEYEMTEYGFTYEEAEEQRIERLNLFLSFEDYMSETSNTAILLAVLAPMAAMAFIAEKRGLFQFKFTRGKSYGSTIIKPMLINAFLVAAWIYFAYMIFTTVGILVTRPTASLSLVGFEFIMEDFFDKHMYWYYVLSGFVGYFLFPFVYCLAASSISLLTSKKYLSIAVPIAYVLGLNIFITSIWGIKYMPILEFIIPTNSISFGGFIPDMGDPLTLALTPMLIPLIFVLGTLIYKIKGSERL